MAKRFGWVGLTVMSAALVLPAMAPAQDEPQKKDTTIRDTKEVVTQPARDVGIDKQKIPGVLLDAQQAPYSLRGTATCAQLAGALDDLDKVLGPDFDSGAPGKKTSVAKVGGAAVVNSIIPFRGIVREVSGAAAADRRYQAATDAGVGRRGFLRGIYLSRRCRPAL
jgi:hypothetical protein